MAILQKELIAICQPTYNLCILKWIELDLYSVSTLPANEEAWETKREYCFQNYPSAVKSLNLFPEYVIK